MMPARVLSLWQPWATLWVTGEKRIETRSWATDYRGILVVHASKRFDEDQRHLCFIEPFKSALERAGVTGPGLMPLGAILGWVDLVGCAQMVVAAPSTDRAINLDVDPRLTDNEREFGNYQPGRFAWLTGERRKVLAEPVPYRGGQGLRVFDLSAARMVQSALAAGSAPPDLGSAPQPNDDPPTR